MSLIILSPLRVRIPKIRDVLDPLLFFFFCIFYLTCKYPQSPKYKCDCRKDNDPKYPCDLNHPILFRVLSILNPVSGQISHVVALISKSAQDTISHPANSLTAILNPVAVPNTNAARTATIKKKIRNVFEILSVFFVIVAIFHVRVIFANELLPFIRPHQH